MRINRLTPSLPEHLVVLTLMLLVAYFGIIKLNNLKKLPKPWEMGTHMRVLCESYPMNTNMTGFREFPKSYKLA